MHSSLDFSPGRSNDSLSKTPFLQQPLNDSYFTTVAHTAVNQSLDNGNYHYAPGSNQTGALSKSKKRLSAQTLEKYQIYGGNDSSGKPSRKVVKKN